MPKVNYGFKGDTAITLSQAIAAGAAVSSQDYGYVAQLGGVTPLYPPGAPTGLTATPGNAQVALSWTAPSSAGSSAVTGYQIVYVADDGSEVTVSAADTSATITGLTNGTSYTFSVAALNASAGAGTPASVSGTPAASNPFTGFERATRNYGGTVGTLIQPGSWSNTASSMTVTVNPGVGVEVFFTVSGATGSIALNGSTAGSARFFSQINYGGGTLEKYGGYSYGNNLNAGSYWTAGLGGPSASGFNPPTTYTYNFTNAVITSMGARWAHGNVNDGTAATYSPAIDYSYTNNGLTLNYKLYSNAADGVLRFTVPAGTARNVTFLANNRLVANGSFRAKRYQTNPLRAASARTGFNQLSDENGPINEWAHPWTANSLFLNDTNYFGSKTITLDPGEYWLTFLASSSATPAEYLDGTIAIA